MDKKLSKLRAMGSDIEISVFGQVPDPAQGVVPAPLLDLQISNLFFHLKNVSNGRLTEIPERV
jgi:hypothetical protein